ncbi:hypothetical protein [Ferviditalea candida]|uniref:Uncharacterized protein n=1 Tax=Ferviditalea candida TaxID=3108399 RepID=A0ABU5ZI83_9BACL|nr:hypothetical protein [Paenibacillaceae bacterium T2]
MGRNALQELEQLDGNMLECAENWKLDQDAAGLGSFLRALEDLEHVIAIHLDGLGERQERLLAYLEDLYGFVRNKDVVAIIDWIEFQMHPFLVQWKKGCEDE